MFDYDDTEAAHLSEIYDDVDEGDIGFISGINSEALFRKKCENGIKSDERRYKINRKAKVGDKIICAGPRCGKKFTKKYYQQCFCCTRCKDQFWNRREAYFGFRKKIII